jgi:UDPglucose--hexose-1-phosphate uridylyltransferase
MVAMPELRFDPLRGEWVAYATERNDRTFLPIDFCPLCPSGPDGRSEVPLADFEVVVFENRFPAFGPDRVGDRPVRPPTTGCEVIVYTPEHQLTLAHLSLERVKLLVDVWADRYLDLGARPDVAYVYVFENKGEEVGVTLHHPHGQIYALPFVPPFAAAELTSARERLSATGPLSSLR